MKILSELLKVKRIVIGFQRFFQDTTTDFINVCQSYLLCISFVRAGRTVTSCLQLQCTYIALLN